MIDDTKIDARVERESQRLCLALLIATLDGQCEEQAPVLVNDVPRTILVDTVHTVVHILAGLLPSEYRPSAREHFHRKLMELS